MNYNVFLAVPEDKRQAVKDTYKNDCGYWVILLEGWGVRGNEFENAINALTLEQVREKSRQITRVEKEDTLCTTI